MPIFGEASEAEVTRAILAGFTKDLGEYASTEVIIVGGGPSGLVAARELALNGVKNVVIERNNYIGGGFWIGGYLMNTVTLRAPARGHRPPGEEPRRGRRDQLDASAGAAARDHVRRPNRPGVRARD